MSTQLYQALDAITGGLPAFMAEGTDETWRQEGHATFSLTAMPPDGMLFGYRVRCGRDANAPDPIYLVSVDHLAKQAKLILLDTPSGYRCFDGVDVDVMDAALMLATTLLEDTQRRRRAGGVEIERRRHRTKEAA